MRYEFLKDHVNHVEGDVDDLDEGLATYLLAVGVVKESKKEKKVAAPAPKKKTTEPVQEKKKMAQDGDGNDAVEKVKKMNVTEKVKDAGPLEPVVNTKPDKHEVAPGKK